MVIGMDHFCDSSAVAYKCLTDHYSNDESVIEMT